VCSGLLKGQGRVLSDSRRDQVEVSIGDLAAQLRVALWPTGQEPCDGWRKRCQDVWFGNVQNHLMDSDRSWKLPILLGGLGLPFGSATRPQLVFANCIIKCGAWDLSRKARLKTKGEKLSVSEQLERLKENLLKEIGAQRMPEGLRPFNIVTMPDGEVRIKDRELFDPVLPSWLVDWSEQEVNEFRRETKFDALVKTVCQTFNGGPMELGDAAEWDQPLRWYSPYTPSVSLLGPETCMNGASRQAMLGAMEALEEERRREPPTEQDLASWPDGGKLHD